MIASSDKMYNIPLFRTLCNCLVLKIFQGKPGSGLTIISIVPKGELLFFEEMATFLHPDMFSLSQHVRNVSVDPRRKKIENITRPRGEKCHYKKEEGRRGKFGVIQTQWVGYREIKNRLCFVEGKKQKNRY